MLVDLGSGMSAQTLLHDLSRGLRSIGAKTEDVYVGAVQGVHEGLGFRHE